MKTISRAEIDRVLGLLNLGARDKAELTQLSAREAVTLIEALAQAPALLAQANHAATCIYCGEAVIYDTRAEADMQAAHRRLVDHDQHCPRNPLVARVAELEARVEQLSSALNESMELHREACAQDGEWPQELAFAAEVWMPGLFGLKCPDGDTCRHSLQGETCGDPLCQTGDAS